jgi:hypothetical protein
VAWNLERAGVQERAARLEALLQDQRVARAFW